MSRKYNKNLLSVLKAYRSGKRYSVHEGGARSGKTTSIIHFLIWFASQQDEPTSVLIIREFATSFSTTIYLDWKYWLNRFGLPNPFETSRIVPSFTIFSTTFYFVGADNPSKIQGVSPKITWVNEAIFVKRDVINQAAIRTTEMMILDYNPSSTSHWIYDEIIPRDDANYILSTYKDNPFLPASIVKEIEGYEPTPDNERQGTADQYMWDVYGLGKRAGRQGLVFRNVNWIKEFPKDVEQVAYGLDFGYVNDPTALIRIAKNGNNLYLEVLMYEPTSDSEYLTAKIRELLPDDAIIWADNSDPVMISDLRRHGIKVFAVKKFSGAIRYGIGLLNSYKLHFVNNKHLRQEQENYIWKEVNGIALDEPIDKYNHAFDAARYAAMSTFRKI